MTTVHYNPNLLGRSVVVMHKPERLSKQTIRLILYLELYALDLLVLVGTPLLIATVSSMFSLHQYELNMVLPLIPIYSLLAANNGTFSLDALRRSSVGAQRAIMSLAMSVLLLLLVTFFLKSSNELSRLALGVGTAATAALLAVARFVFSFHVQHMTNGRPLDELVIVDGVAPPRQTNGAQVVLASRLGLEPNLNDPVMLHRFGALSKSFDRILIASVPERQSKWSLLLKGGDIYGDILMHQVNPIGAIGVGHFGDMETMQVARKPLNMSNRIKKRLLDLVITVPLLTVLLPIMGIIALLIKIESPGPVLFKQERVGQGNRLFEVLKFRSMRVEAGDKAGCRSASRDDDRITRVGRIIRGTSIDELPQLLNVLNGDMSLVGPRPHALGSMAGEQLFWEVDQTYWHRHQLKPGITGLAQIRGHRGATLELSDLTDRLRADMEYVQGWNLWRDIVILVNTARVLIHKNAF